MAASFRMEHLPLLTIAGSNEVIAVELSDTIEFDKDRKPTGKVIGQTLEVCCPAKNFNKIKVALPNTALPVTSAEIASLNATGNFVKVTFTNFDGTIWQNYKTRDVGISAKADSVSFTNLPAKGVKVGD